MNSSLKRFASNQEGAVTVDFVALTAVVLGLGLLVAGPVLGNAGNWGGAIVALLASAL